MVKQERAARTRRSLILAAAEVFAEEGFVSASLTAISRRAGVSNGALHFHFDSKNGLACGVEEEAARRVRRLTVLAGADGPPALQLLVDSTHALMRGLADDVVVRAGFELSGDLSRVTGVDLRGEWRCWIETVLQRAAAQGALADGVSYADAASAILAATVGFQVLGARGDKDWISRRTLTGFWELMLPRLAARDALDTVVTCGSRCVVGVPEVPVEEPV
ncbi:ScbR family autoregulator-binding transcription factor [Streptomyces liangshanensis]|uniref:TetR/AcrR family transcriptional regulator n=1 Tax=Streptomyces liangshanensis TaxID=2717324 RepID=A0A6G9GSC7_9ACTN|nr:ScbR family autoregulator-binding transcription factor [Streptomyces liangshanensis]QIQ01110.1 TetR/AcrR family transcriptional regulator [Streptomyces liangshanensis]